MPDPPPRQWTSLPEAARPRALETYAPPDTTRLVVERQAAQRAGQVPEAPPPLRPTVNALACRTCRQVRCRCGVPTLGNTTEQVVLLQRQRGTRA